MTSQRETSQYPGPAERHEELTRIDELMRDLDVRLDTSQGRMREHLAAARSYLLRSRLDAFVRHPLPNVP
jgi:hypothetical protein